MLQCPPSLCSNLGAPSARDLFPQARLPEGSPGFIVPIPLVEPIA
jgi:hypothetical protein